MRFTAVLLLIALAGALISAQTGSAQDSANASPQETPAAAQPDQSNSPLKSIIDKGISVAGKVFEDAEKKGKDLVEKGVNAFGKLKKDFGF